MPGLLDRFGKMPLIICRDSSDAPRYDLAAFCNELDQCIDVFVIDMFNSGSSKRA